MNTGFHAIDWAAHQSAHVRTRGAMKRNGRMIFWHVYADKQTRDDTAADYRAIGKQTGDGRVVSVGTRVVKFDNVAITTYVLIVREKSSEGDPK